VSLSDAGDGTGTLTLEPGTGVAVGTYTVEVTADDGQATSAPEEFAVYVDEPSVDGTVVVAVNAGGGEYVAADGTTYTADQYFSGGTAFTSGASGTPTDPAIANTDDDTLYQSERFGTFSYAVPVENGDYEVTLQFAEIYQGVSTNDDPAGTDGTNENDRLFDVAIEGQTVVTSYDIFSEVGPLTASDKHYTVTVTDGELNIAFTTVADNAKLSAFRVESLDAGPGPVGNFENPPTDTDGDGVYEDINGDGTADFNDVQALFANTADPTVQSNVDAFDFNGDGSVDFNDVQALFVEVSGG
jgi:PKD repeat protein